VTLGAEARQEELSSDGHPLSPLFHIVHELIAEIRMLDDGDQA